MSHKFASVALFLAASSLMSGQKKEDERLANATSVLQESLGGDRGLPVPVLQQSRCIAIFPSVKKAAIGIGASYGRGVLVCRKGANMNQGWGDPAMYSLDEGSLGVQFGTTATDFVLAILSENATNRILDGKTKLGSNAAVAAGPTGAQASAFSPQAEVLTYSRTKGVFAGVSLQGASIDADKDANKALYGRELTARAIVASASDVPSAGQPLVNLLDKTSPTRD